MQLITGHSGANQGHEIAKILRRLKVLAGELDVPIILLSQLDKDIENRVDKRPVISDLRKMGIDQQDIDLALFIHRHEIYEADKDQKGTAEVIFKSLSVGTLGVTRLTFSSDHLRFENYPRLAGVKSD